VSGLPQLLLLEAGISELSWKFRVADINFCGGGDDKFLVCSTLKSMIEGKNSNCKQQVTM
jgi:hypothetical protein